MKKYLMSFSLCLALALSAAPARAADDDAALQKTIENRYADMRAAIQHGNPEEYRDALTSDFSATDLAGKTHDADAIINTLGQTVPDDSRKETSTVTSLKQDGDTVVVWQTDNMKTMRVAETGDTKINYRMMTKSTDTWIKDKDSWKLQKTVATSADIWIDDKLVAHQIRSAAVEPVAGRADKKTDDKKPADKKKPAPAK